jgi:hypothetical protein
MHTASLMLEIIMCAIIKTAWASADHTAMKDFEIRVGMSNVVELLDVYSDEIFFLGSHDTVESCMQACSNHNEGGKTCVSFSWHGNPSSGLDAFPCFARADKGWTPRVLEGAVSGRLLRVSSHGQEGSEQCMEAKADTVKHQDIFYNSKEEPPESRDARAHQPMMNEHGSESGVGGRDQKVSSVPRHVNSCTVLEWRLFRTFKLGDDIKMIMSAR